MSAGRTEMNTMYAELQVLKMEVAELKCLGLMQNALIGRLCAELAEASEGTRDTHAVLSGMLSSLDGVVDRIGEAKPQAAATMARRILGQQSNDIGEAEGKALWKMLRARA